MTSGFPLPRTHGIIEQIFAKPLLGAEHKMRQAQFLPSRGSQSGAGGLMKGQDSGAQRGKHIPFPRMSVVDDGFVPDTSSSEMCKDPWGHFICNLHSIGRCAHWICIQRSFSCCKHEMQGQQTASSLRSEGLCLLFHT